MKICRECDTMLPLSSFYKHAQMADGYLNKCKTCVKNRVKKHRSENLEAIQEYDRQRANLPHRVEARSKYRQSERYQEKHTKSNKKYRKNNPDKYEAHNQVRDALLKGTLEKSNCIICNSVKTEAHHEDYSKPLDVIWFCSKHHKLRHKRLRDSYRKNLLEESLDDFITFVKNEELIPF